MGAKVLQIATDCVYSGHKGRYSESDHHDALDVYGKTKSLGECHLPSINHLRCSIIGPETKDHKFLVDWFLGQPQGAAVKGFSNHQWNGVTTLHFAKICRGIIREDLELPHLQHVIPGDIATKAEMLRAFGRYFNRPDIKIEVVEAATTIDRTLQTENRGLNQAIWAAAGYEQPPTVEEMIRELSTFTLRMRRDSR
jgi:dTDP-4-dehydrorhamnose reductase